MPLNYFFNKSLFLEKVSELADYIKLNVDQNLTKIMHQKWIEQNIKEFERRKNDN